MVPLSFAPAASATAPESTSDRAKERLAGYSLDDTRILVKNKGPVNAVVTGYAKKSGENLNHYDIDPDITLIPGETAEIQVDGLADGVAVVSRRGYLYVMDTDTVITGQTEPGAPVTGLIHSDLKVYTTQADSWGRFEFEIAAEDINDESHSLKIIAGDAEGVGSFNPGEAYGWRGFKERDTEWEAIEKGAKVGLGTIGLTFKPFRASAEVTNNPEAETSAHIEVNRKLDGNQYTVTRKRIYEFAGWHNNGKVRAETTKIHNYRGDIEVENVGSDPGLKIVENGWVSADTYEVEVEPEEGLSEYKAVSFLLTAESVNGDVYEGVPLPEGTLEIDYGENVEIIDEWVEDFRADFRYSPSSPTDLDTVQFADESSDNFGLISSWRWDLDGDGEWDSTRRNPAHSYADDGSYDVSLKVADENGLTSTYEETVEILNVGPNANFGFSPSSPTTEDVVRFADLSSDPDGEIVGYRWDFDGDDGWDSTLKNPGYIFGSSEVISFISSPGNPGSGSDSDSDPGSSPSSDTSSDSGSDSASDSSSDSNSNPETSPSSDTSSDPGSGPNSDSSSDSGSDTSSDPGTSPGSNLNFPVIEPVPGEDGWLIRNDDVLEYQGDYLSIVEGNTTVYEGDRVLIADDGRIPVIEGNEVVAYEGDRDLDIGPDDVLMTEMMAGTNVVSQVDGEIQVDANDMVLAIKDDDVSVEQGADITVDFGGGDDTEVYVSDSGWDETEVRAVLRPVTLKVTDDDGASDVRRESVVVENRTPIKGTLTVDADVKGEEYSLPQVKVWVDGELWASDGSVHTEDVEPGLHEVEFEESTSSYQLNKIEASNGLEETTKNWMEVSVPSGGSMTVTGLYEKTSAEETDTGVPGYEYEYTLYRTFRSPVDNKKWEVDSGTIWLDDYGESFEISGEHQMGDYDGTYEGAIMEFERTGGVTSGELDEYSYEMIVKHHVLGGNFGPYTVDSGTLRGRNLPDVLPSGKHNPWYSFGYWSAKVLFS